MNKRLRNILIFCSLSVLLVVLSAAAASVGSVPATQKFGPDGFRDYNLALTGSEKGVDTYSGKKNNLRLIFSIEEDQVRKMILTYDNNIAAGERQTLSLEILDLSGRLFPGKIVSLAEAQQKLYEELDNLKTDRDDKVFVIDRLRFEINLVNDLVNIRVTAVQPTGQDNAAMPL